jgi:hypothetical protein
MKKLVLALASLCLAAAPVIACPGHMDKADDPTPRTAEKDQAPKADKADKAKDAPKTAKPAEKKPADKTADKKADKVSQR